MTETCPPEGAALSWDDLAAKASVARECAYAPYSRFLVGAALEADDGRVFTGCNVENASYPVGTCAERMALGQAVVSGARSFARIVVATSGAVPASPCGMCRQALAEFGMDLEVMSVGAGGEATTWRLRDLLPAHFSPESLESLERVAARPEAGS
ncbi:cytidine deaminase [Candidatus Palauibacter sp.]|uniref:cytidine deaminase n=1 Tax=Candidatus Palauibacter sp. TaxID=3101350 RepID=UPI003B5CACE1